MKLFINKIIIVTVVILLFADFNLSLELNKSETTVVDEQNICINFDISDIMDEIEKKDPKPEFFQKAEKWLKNPNSKINMAMRFARGPCKPVIVVPGIFSTRLSLIIDCKKLKADKDLEMEKDVRFFCGMRSICKNDTDQVIYDNFWPAVLGNEGMMKSKFSDKDNACMGFFMKFLNRDCAKDNKYEKCRHKKYIKLIPEGLQKTDFSKEDNKINNMYFKCGFSAVNNILEGSGIAKEELEKRDKLGFANLYESLKTMGYMEGFNMAAVPYEFKEAFCENQEFKDTFTKMVKLLYDNTGKKVVIVAHSYGNLNVHHQLTNVEGLSDMIDHFVSIAPPFAGSPKADILLAKGTEEFKSKTGEIEINFNRFAQSLAFPYMPAMSKMRSSNYFESFESNASVKHKEMELLKHLEKEVKLSTCVMQKINKNAESKIKNETTCKDSGIDYDDKTNLFKDFFEEEFKWKIDQANICGSKEEINERIAKMAKYNNIKSPNKFKPILDPCEFRIYDIKNCPLIKTVETQQQLTKLTQAKLVGLMCPNHKKEEKPEEVSNDVHCANENENCECTGTVSFGVFGENPKYHEQDSTGSIDCNNTVFGDPTPGVVKTCRCDSTRVWKHCANENEPCKCNGNVWFGANGKIHGKESTDVISCNNGVFGDPIPGTVKTCKCDDSSERKHCSDENIPCKCKGTVYFGANGYIHQKEATSGEIACNNTMFEDPIPGTVKTCKCKLAPVEALKEKPKKIGYYVHNKVSSPIDPNSVDAYLDQYVNTPHMKIFKEPVKALNEFFEKNKLIQIEAKQKVDEKSATLQTDYTPQRLKEVIEFNHKLCSKQSIESNPKVNTTIIFNKSIETRGAYLINDKEQGVQSRRQTVWVGGDGTVNVDSAIVAGLRWLNQKKHEPKKFPDIRLLDYCSPIKTDDKTKEYIYTKEKGFAKKYQFLNCECKPTKNENAYFEDVSPCSHSNMLSDEHIKNTIIDILNTTVQPGKVKNSFINKIVPNIVKNRRNYEKCRKIFTDAYIDNEYTDLEGYPTTYQNDPNATAAGIKRFRKLKK